jgi:DNA-binding CsgD family transcriptional regulator
MSKLKGVKAAKTSKLPKKRDAIANYGSLSKQELKIMQLMVQGLHHKKIEDQLNIAYETFKTHRKNIFNKLKIKNIVQLTQLALEHNFVKKLAPRQTLVFMEITERQRKQLAHLSGKKRMSIKQYCEAEIGKHLKAAR